MYLGLKMYYMNFLLLESSTCLSPVKKSYNLLNIELHIHYQLLGSQVIYSCNFISKRQWRDSDIRKITCIYEES